MARQDLRNSTYIVGSELHRDGLLTERHFIQEWREKRRLRVTANAGQVTLSDLGDDFYAKGLTVRDNWISFTPSEARHIAGLLMEAAAVSEQAAPPAPSSPAPPDRPGEPGAASGPAPGDRP